MLLLRRRELTQCPGSVYAFLVGLEPSILKLGCGALAQVSSVLSLEQLWGGSVRGSRRCCHCPEYWAVALEGVESGSSAPKSI